MSSRHTLPLLLLSAALSSAACHGELVPVSVDDDDDDGGGVDAGSLPSWDPDIGPMLAARGCVACHGDAGSYSLATYADALGPGTDALANVIPGDPSSALVTYGRGGHGGLPAPDADHLETWVVRAAAGER